jgi:hypothetical protein
MKIKLNEILLKMKIMELPNETLEIYIDKKSVKRFKDVKVFWEGEE